MRKLNFLIVCLLTGMIAGIVYAGDYPVPSDSDRMQQTEKLTGTVRDEYGTVSGASVAVKGTTRGVVTGLNGEFALDVRRGETVAVTFIGYVTKEFLYQGENHLTVTLEEDLHTLAEVVVTAMGIRREAKALGYAMTTISAGELVKTATPNFAAALYGKAPGVRVQAAPGGNMTAVSISVRGLSSITGTTQPLVVVDGVPIRNGDANTTGYWTDQRIRQNGLVDVNPEDIESLTILKGASASALYGSEAANGVVMITTKSGKLNQGIGIELGMNITADFVAYMPEYQTVFGPGSRVGARTEGYNQLSGGFWEREWNGRRYQSIQSANTLFGPKYDGSDILYFDGSLRKYEAGGNPWSEIFRTAVNQNYNITVTQGNENGNMRFAYTHVNALPNQYNSHYQKNNFSVNGSYALNKHLKIDYSAHYIVQYYKNRPYRISRLTNNMTGMANAWTDVKSIRNHTVTSRGYLNVIAPDRSPTPDESFVYNFGCYDLVTGYFWNILGKEEIENNNRFLASVAPSWLIMDGLRLQGRMATDYTSVKTEDKDRSERPLAYGDPTGYYALQQRNHESIYGDVTFLFDRRITETMGVVAHAGWMGRTEKMSASKIGTDGGLMVENWFHINASKNQARSEQGVSDYLKTAFFATLGLSWNGFLFLEGTARREKTSVLAQGNNTFFYPSVNASFIYTDAFRKALPDWYNYGKLRASYGIVGNAPAIYKASAAYEQNTVSGYIYNMTKEELANTKLVPEKKHEIELGWENKLFGNRLGFDVSFYHNVVKDQILRTSLPITSGGSSIWMNVGELQNSGLEMSIYAVPVQSRHLFWSIQANMAFNKNKVNKLADGLSVLTHEIMDNGAVAIESHAGKPMGDIYAYSIQTDGNGNAIIGNDGFGILTDERVKVGNAMPKATGGFNTTFGYKNLTLDVTLDFRIGGAIVNMPYQYMMGRGSLVESMKGRDARNGGLSYYFKDNNHAAGVCVPFDGKSSPNGEIVYDNGIILDGVKQDGSKNDVMIPADIWYNWTYNWGTDAPTYYAHSIFDNSYCKVREVVLSYRLPKQFTGKIACRDLTVSVFGRGLFYLYKNIPIFDVEATDGTTWVSQASIGGSTATTRTFGFSLRASF